MATEGIRAVRAHARFYFLLADMPHPGMGVHTRTYRDVLAYGLPGILDLTADVSFF